MATVTITKMADWSLYPGDRGFNAVWAFCKTSHSPTGGCYYPADLRTIYNVPGSEISYATWFSNLASAGVNLVRIKMTGRNRSCAGDLCGFEPPPYGTYNIWQSDLDSHLPGDLPGYRADQITYPPGAAAWNASNLKEAVEQAEANSVQFMPIFFEAKEFTDDWQYHPWYNSNKYVDGTACVPADQGFIANAFDFYTDATAKTQAKARIKCAIDLIGGYNVVKVWALFSEIPWCMVPSFWGEPSWNAATITNIRTKTVPWVAEMAQYIRDIVASLPPAPPWALGAGAAPAKPVPIAGRAKAPPARAANWRRDIRVMTISSCCGYLSLEK